ncbi:hypothetical protein EV426DRAFT_579629 [Tirmania nivea]|nr:hypothetical protein EV426DRAFT_579629 [Tirmania nivea]
MIDQSGWGLRPEENEQSINAVLEKKCPFFWRLDGVWGEHPNASFSGGLEILSCAEPRAPSQPPENEPPAPSQPPENEPPALSQPPESEPSGSEPPESPPTQNSTLASPPLASSISSRQNSESSSRVSRSKKDGTMVKAKAKRLLEEVSITRESRKQKQAEDALELRRAEMKWQEAEAQRAREERQMEREERRSRSLIIDPSIQPIHLSKIGPSPGLWPR